MTRVGEAYQYLPSSVSVQHLPIFLPVDISVCKIDKYQTHMFLNTGNMVFLVGLLVKLKY